MNDALLSCKNLTITAGAQCLIESLNFTIEPKQCWVVLGPNGSGKTRLLHTLAGLDPISSGQLLFNNTATTQLSLKQRTQHLGLLMQHSQRGLYATVYDLVLSGRFNHTQGLGWYSDADHQLVEKIISDTDLQALKNAPLEQLSGGELRRAEISRLIAQSPTVALLDEPLNHLDIPQQIQLLKQLKANFVSEQKSLLMVLHNPNIAAQIASHVILLFPDKPLIGTVESLLSRDNLSRLYQHPWLNKVTEQNNTFTPDYSTLHEQ